MSEISTTRARMFDEVLGAASPAAPKPAVPAQVSDVSPLLWAPPLLTFVGVLVILSGVRPPSVQKAERDGLDFKKMLALACMAAALCLASPYLRRLAS
jgi:hypothetical protein